MPFFSVIIPSRNRPELLAEAVASVLAQDFTDLEVIVVDDGSRPSIRPEDLGLPAWPDDRVRIVKLDYQPRGRGPSYSRNIGVWASSGSYCAFLDDDDTWTSVTHLSRAHACLTRSTPAPDIYLSNQTAYFPDGRPPRELWLYPLVERLRAEGRTLEQGCFPVSIDDLVSAKGFSHLNTLIIARTLFDQIGGLDEYISYEEDMDFYYRAIGAAESIVLSPEIVARHNVPDHKAAVNASTRIAYRHKMQMRLYLLDKLVDTTRSPAIAAYCNRYAANTLKMMAEQAVENAEYGVANSMARRAVAREFSLKWLLYSIYLSARALMEGGRSHGG